MIFAFDPRNVKWVNHYEHLLHSDVGGVNPCATQETIPALWTVAAIIGNILVKYKKESVFTNNFYQAIINYDGWPSLVSEAYPDI